MSRVWYFHSFLENVCEFYIFFHKSFESQDFSRTVVYFQKKIIFSFQQFPSSWCRYGMKKKNNMGILKYNFSRKQNRKYILLDDLQYPPWIYTNQCCWLFFLVIPLLTTFIPHHNFPATRLNRKIYNIVVSLVFNRNAFIPKVGNKLYFCHIFGVN